MKAVKNAAEIAGARAAHLRDGAARDALSRLVRPRSARRQAHRDRRRRGAGELPPRHRRCSRTFPFPTIAGAGPNGAIVHYRVTRKTNRRIAPGELFLIDSGAQYEDGTTDITRTIAIGEPTAEMRDRFTRVLKGHIAIARAVFPDGTTGAQLDRWRGNSSGRPASISITAPATASAAISRCTKARRGSPSSAPRRSSAA